MSMPQCSNEPNVCKINAQLAEDARKWESLPNTQDSLASFLLSLATSILKLFQLFQAPLHLIWVFFHSLLVGWRGNIQNIEPQHQPRRSWMMERTNRAPKPKKTDLEKKIEEAMRKAAEERDRRESGKNTGARFRRQAAQKIERQKKEEEDNEKIKLIVRNQIECDRAEQRRPPERPDSDMTELSDGDDDSTSDNANSAHQM